MYDLNTVKMLYVLGMVGMGVQGGPIGAIGGIASGMYMWKFYIWMIYPFIICVYINFIYVYAYKG
jgi:hypothetical protein